MTENRRWGLKQSEKQSKKIIKIEDDANPAKDQWFLVRATNGLNLLNKKNHFFSFVYF